jgi:hypothetical protein
MIRINQTTQWQPQFTGLGLPPALTNSVQQAFSLIYSLRDAVSQQGGLADLVDYGTHAERTATAPASVPNGTFWSETDRGNVIYQARVPPAVQNAAWVYIIGTYSDVAANRPTDLGANDQGFTFYATDTKVSSTWNGTAWSAGGGGGGTANFQFTVSTGAHLLTTTATAIPGCQLTLNNAGHYWIVGAYDFTIASGDAGFSLVGELTAGGVTQAQSATFAGGTHALVTQQWFYDATATGVVVAMTALKTGGTGASTTSGSSTLAAMWIGA